MNGNTIGSLPRVMIDQSEMMASLRNMYSGFLALANPLEIIDTMQNTIHMSEIPLLANDPEPQGNQMHPTLTEISTFGAVFGKDKFNGYSTLQRHIVSNWKQYNPAPVIRDKLNNMITDYDRRMYMGTTCSGEIVNNGFFTASGNVYNTTPVTITDINDMIVLTQKLIDDVVDATGCNEDEVGLIYKGAEMRSFMKSNSGSTLGTINNASNQSVLMSTFGSNPMILLPRTISSIDTVSAVYLNNVQGKSGSLNSIPSPHVYNQGDLPTHQYGYFIDVANMSNGVYIKNESAHSQDVTFSATARKTKAKSEGK